MFSPSDTPDDQVRCAEERPASGAGDAHGRNWRILVVDNDADAHAGAASALDGAHILDRSVELFHAHTSAEARAILGNDAEFAVILLDMAMERGDAGLALVKVIREELGLRDTRIILRTAHAGYAPELDAIRDYDISDYKTKSELTRAKLVTALTTAIRSYDQLRAISASRRGLDLLSRASTELMGHDGLQAFASGVLVQLAGLLGIAAEGLVCAQDVRPDGSTDLLVVAAAGRFTYLIGHSLSNLPERRVLRAVLQCQTEQRNLFDDEHTVLFFAGKASRNMAAYLTHPQALDDLDRRLLEVFCGNISVGMDNVSLFSRLHDFAYYDQLLGLPNRTRFVNILTESLQNPRAPRGALALVDIDHFADTNDTLGHQFGDQLLKAVAERLQAQLDDCIVARVSGDTFGILGGADRVTSDTIHDIFATPFLIGENELMVSVTTGLVRLDDFGTTGSDALKQASIALKRGKTRHRGNCSYFSREMGEDIRERVVLLNELRHAFNRSQLTLYYQPQVSLEDTATVGLEALLRWQVAKDVFVPPNRFVHLAEHSGLIVGLGEWALRTACRQLARLHASGYPTLRMAVNVSLVQFRHPRFIEVLHQALDESGISPDCLDLEITESMAMEEPSFILDTLKAIKTIGVKISVDDFGTGFSSLSHLQKLHVDRLKIDRSFISEISQSTRGSHIAEMVVQLGHHLALEVIAEGVETREQAEILKALGCQEAQGYYFGKPMMESDLPGWLERNGAGSRTAPVPDSGPRNVTNPSV